MPEDILPLFVRRSKTNPEEFEVVDCPYENVPTSGNWSKFTPGLYIRACVDARTVLCLGGVCAIYPCQRVREFQEGA